MRPAVIVRSLLLMLGAGLLAACQRGLPAVAFHAEKNPARLRDWHVVQIRGGRLVLNRRVVPYAVNTKLFSDYAYKLRTVWMPKGVSARYEPTRTFDFPVGTIISKTFYYPLPAGAKRNDTDVAETYKALHAFVPGKGLDLSRVHLIETRLLVHRKHGWVGLPYVWNARQTQARLTRTGAVKDLALVNDKGKRQPFSYVVPDATQCAICHNYTHGADDDASARSITPIGPKARHLNRDYPYPGGSENQLVHWTRIGYLSGVPGLAKVPRNANWADPGQPLQARARAYLDANCSYCHNPHGEANYTALWLSSNQPFGMHTGLCKIPVAAGRATGNKLFDVVPGQPDASIMVHRLQSTQVGVMMPELGRITSDRKGVALIRAWIASLKGQCAIIHNENAAP